METDSEELMQQGIATGAETFRNLLDELGWQHADIDRTICHQVGGTHRKLMLDALGLSSEKDYTTFPWLGNTGSVALPITLAIAAEREFITADQNIAMLGIGSGINCVMLGANWQVTRVLGNSEKEELQIAK